ncbi:zinc finger CCCH domain-containing protein 15-like [Oscarella lobularis]|uniref:zinc finger CCCH domain-containing protein 15-like n=1 Tax=Oscarella lobularis TaxID=121494 RepID=UPI0033132B81
MPPKKPSGKKSEPSKKTVEKQKEKVIEDKTFGLKNKKGRKQQQFVKSVTHQIKYGNKSAQKIEQEKAEAKAKKSAARKELDEINSLFRPSQSVSKGADPKSVLCAFFKQGTCTKGDKCKFSHDLTQERKAEKRSLYIDRRDDELESDTMDTWDQAKLEEVVERKHGKGQPTRTEIICKYFLDAVEKGLYGWFWNCPNGDKCIYRHALPPGFVLKREKKAMDEQAREEISLEELIEEERAKLSAKAKLTPVTLQSFVDWKKRKMSEKKQKAAKILAKKKMDFKQGRMFGVSGREVFAFNPELVDEGETDGDDDVIYYRKEDSDDERDERDLTEMEFSLPALDEMASRSVFADGVLEIDGIEIDASLFASEADFDLDEDDDDENSDDSDVG